MGRSDRSRAQATRKAASGPAKAHAPGQCGEVVAELDSDGLAALWSVVVMTLIGLQQI